jgi:hypothetical protein
MEPEGKTLHIGYRMLEAKAHPKSAGIGEIPCFLAGTISVQS